MAENFGNNYTSTLASDLASDGTSAVVTSATGAPSADFRALITDGVNCELVMVTAKSGTTLTLTRAQEGTGARSWSTGATFAHVLTAGALDLFVRAADEVDIASDDALVQGVNFEDQGSDPTAPASGHTILYTKGGSVYKRAAGGGAVALGAGGASDASDVTYTPSTLADWDGSSDPGNADGALDQLAGRVADLEAVAPGADANAIHDNVAGEIAALTEKASPVDADLILIEDSEDSNSKKKVQIGSLPTGGTGSGAAISTSAYASPPGSPAAGDLWLPSNGVAAYRYSGSVWAPWGPIYPLAKPPLVSALTWVNQGSATADEVEGGFYLLAPAVAGDQMRLLVASAPATPWTFTVCLLPHMHLENYNGVGLVYRQSSDGKLVNFGVGNLHDAPLTSAKWNSETSWSGAYADFKARAYGSCIWLRLADDGANRICSWSLDGAHFHAVHTIGRTDFLTANQVGVYANSNGSFPCGLTVLSWKVA